MTAVSIAHMVAKVRDAIERQAQPKLTAAEWKRLMAQARQGQPAGLFEAFYIRRVVRKPEAVALVEELRRVRKRGRPSHGTPDPLRAAAHEWQRYEARFLYRHALKVYQWAREADDKKGSYATEDHEHRTIEFGPRSRVRVVRGFGLSPKELAIAAAAFGIGREQEAVRKLLFSRKNSHCNTAGK